MANRADATTSLPMLGQRALNRALLDRQMLLERSSRAVPGPSSTCSASRPRRPGRRTSRCGPGSTGSIPTSWGRCSPTAGPCAS